MSDGTFAQDVWIAAIELLRSSGQLSDSQNAFVRLAQPLAVIEDQFLVGVSSAFTRDLILDHVGEPLTQQLSAILGRPVRLEISVDSTFSQHPAPTQNAPQKPSWASSSDRSGGEHHEYKAHQHEYKTQQVEKPSRVSDLGNYGKESTSEDPTDYLPTDEPHFYDHERSNEQNRYLHSVPTQSSSTEDRHDGMNFSQPVQQPQQAAARLNPRYTFDSFVIGESNRFARATARAVAEQPSFAYNPLFLYSDSGMGKTHLLHAIGNYVQEIYDNKKVIYVSAEEFTNYFINAIQNGQMHNFKDQFRNVDVLLIDDIQFLSGTDRARTLEEFFHTFNALINANKQIVITSDVAPNLLTGFEDRMISRFNSGITAEIAFPNLETRIAILNAKARAEGTYVPGEVNEYIASKMTTNVREMEGALRRVKAFADLTGQQITVELAESQLKDLISDPASIQVTAALIMAQVALAYDIPVEDLKSPNRTRTLTHPRHIAMYLCREMTDLSLPKIAEVFNRRDHTTVLNALKKIEALMAEKQNVYNQVSTLTTQIKNAAKEQAQLNKQ